MSVWALVPLKALNRAKKRLASELPAAERRRLVETMYNDVLAVLASVRGLAGVAVVTDERGLVPSGVRRIEDLGEGLNAAVARASARLEREGATSVLSLAADIPFASKDEIEAVLAAGRKTPVVIVPDRHGSGTNALLLSPPTRLAPAFGEASHARHTAMARALGFEPETMNLPGLGFDVDDPADLRDLRQAVAGRPSYRFLIPELQAVP